MIYTAFLVFISLGISCICVFCTSLFQISPYLAFLIIPFFLICYSTLFLFTCFFLMIYGHFIKKSDKEYEPSRFASFVVHEMTFQFLVFSLVKVKKEGMERLPKKPALYIFNHSSSFDAIVYLASRKLFRHIFISKPENVDVPFIGPWVKRAGFISISRSDPIKAAHSFMRASNLLKKGYSIAVSPEGTRSQTGHLLDFHAAAFEPAYLAKCPIVIIAMQNNASIHDRLFRFTTVHLDLVDVLPYESFKNKKAAEVSEIAKKKLGDYLEAHQDRLYDPTLEE